MTECCARPVDRDESARLAGDLKVLADPTRLHLLAIIAASPQGEACVCELTDPVGLSQPTVSHHMKVLTQAGLVTRERRGTWVYYATVPDRLRALTDRLHATLDPA